MSKPNPSRLSDSEIATALSDADRVVAIPGAGESGGVVSGNSEPDRSVMGLLRAVADAILVGAGTFSCFWAYGATTRICSFATESLGKLFEP